MEQVIRAVSGLSAKVDQLADQIEALKKGKA
jgi:outer membrane murein-binding lipoprotein Lpp